MNVQIGDWVTSSSSGIWRVYRILDNVLIADASKGTNSIDLVFSSKFLSESYKPLFKSECCSPSLVRKLDQNEMNKLQLFIDENPDKFKKFDKRSPKNVDGFCDVFFSRPDDKSAEEITNYFDKNQKYKASEISNLMDTLNLNWAGNPSWRIEFKSSDHECENGELVYTFNKVLEF